MLLLQFLSSCSVSISKCKDEVGDEDILSRMKAGISACQKHLADSQHILQWKELPEEAQLDRHTADLVTPIILVLTIPCTCLKDVYLQTNLLFLATLCTCLKDVYLQCHVFICNPMQLRAPMKPSKLNKEFAQAITDLQKSTSLCNALVKHSKRTCFFLVLNLFCLFC